MISLSRNFGLVPRIIRAATRRCGRNQGSSLENSVFLREFVFVRKGNVRPPLMRWVFWLCLVVALESCGGGGGGTAGGGGSVGSSPPAVVATGAQFISQTNAFTFSADGRYVGYEGAVSGRTNGIIYDRLSGSNTTVGVTPAGGFADADANLPCLSPDGRYALFLSRATNLIAGSINYPVDTQGNHTAQLYVRDFQLGVTKLVSIDPSGTSGSNRDIGFNLLSRNGRFVAFTTDATNLVSGVIHRGGENVFVRDLQTGTTELISVSADGLETGNQSSTINGGTPNSSSAIAISDDGRYVAFLSVAWNLVTGIAYGLTPSDSFNNVFRRDRQSGTTQLVSIAPTGTDGNFGSVGVQTMNILKGRYMSGDGNVIAFSSTAPNLAPGLSGGVNQKNVYVRFMSSPAPQLVSRGVGAGAANSGSSDPVLSHNGQYVAFASGATNLIADPVTYWTIGLGPGGPPVPNIYRWSTATGDMVLVSRSTDGTSAGDFESMFPEFSDDGKIIAFYGASTTLTENPSVALTFRDTQDNIYYWDESSGKVRIASQRDGRAMGKVLTNFSISPDGKSIGFIETFGQGYVMVF